MKLKKKEPLYDKAILMALPSGFNPDEIEIAKHTNCNFCNQELWLSELKAQVVNNFKAEGKGIYVLCPKCIVGWYSQTRNEDDLNNISFDVENISDYSQEDINDIAKVTAIKKNKNEHNTDSDTNKVD